MFTFVIPKTAAFSWKTSMTLAVKIDHTSEDGGTAPVANKAAATLPCCAFCVGAGADSRRRGIGGRHVHAGLSRLTQLCKKSAFYTIDIIHEY
jgi:hypothetical protein